MTFRTEMENLDAVVRKQIQNEGLRDNLTALQYSDVPRSSRPKEDGKHPEREEIKDSGTLRHV